MAHNMRYWKAYHDGLEQGLSEQECIQAGLKAENEPTPEALASAMQAAALMGRRIGDKAFGR